MVDNKEKTLYDNADKFIDLANQMAKTQTQGDIGMAMRYAAARYSAFEASVQQGDLAENRDKFLQFFADTFREMLEKNFEEYIQIQEKNKKD